MSRRLAAATVLAICLARPAAAVPKQDTLTALEQNPSPSATEQIAKLYHHSKDPYARFWLMDVLYDRVRLYHDTGAMALLWEASKDSHPDVRRKAISDLEVFHFLPETQGRVLWMKRIHNVAQESAKDPLPSIRSAGRDLEKATKRWQAEGDPQDSSSNAPVRPLYPLRTMIPIFVWAVCFQFIGYGWHRMGTSLLQNAGPSGQAVLKSVEAYKKNLSLLAFPALTTLCIFTFLGTALGWALISAVMSPSTPAQPLSVLQLAEICLVVYVISWFACFLPAAIMIGTMVGGFIKTIKRIVGIIFLASLSLICWPLEALTRLLPLQWLSEGPFGWLTKVGTPFAAILTTGVMVQGDLSASAALAESVARFPGAQHEPGVEFWGRAPFQVSVVLWCLASPVLFSLSLLPARMFGLHPNQIFEFWFLSDAQFAVGFGWWAGILLSMSGFGHLLDLGAVRASEMVRESFHAKQKLDIKQVRGK